MKILKNKASSVAILAGLALALTSGIAANASVMSSTGSAGGGPSTTISTDSDTLTLIGSAGSATSTLAIPNLVVTNTFASIATNVVAPIVSAYSNSSLNSFPGVPNTGGPAIGTYVYSITYTPTAYLSPNGTAVARDASGMVHVSGRISTMFPGVIGLVSDTSQTWSVRWTGDMSRFQVGDTVAVDGFIDSTLVSQINATSVRDLSR